MPHPNVHPRLAYVCQHASCVPPHRVFLAPGDPEPPNCPDGHGKMQRQANVPYSRPDTSKPIGRGRRLDGGSNAAPKRKPKPKPS